MSPALFYRRPTHAEFFRDLAEIQPPLFAQTRVSAFSSDEFFLHFIDAEDVQIVFNFGGPSLESSFLLNEVFLSNVPAFSHRPYRVQLEASEALGVLSAAEGSVLADTPHRLVMTIFAFRHSKIVKLPEVNWSGTFQIRATCIPEPAATLLLASGFDRLCGRTLAAKLVGIEVFSSGARGRKAAAPSQIVQAFSAIRLCERD